MNRRFMDKLAHALPFLPGLLAFLPGLLAFLPGLVAFLAVIGPRAVDPRNLAWLEGGDRSTHYLGWLFFRQSDWTLPLGLNPDYGLELSSSVVYSDSIPLLALFFKPFDAWLSHPFQYFGLWLLTCFLLHGYFAWKLVGLISTDTLLRLAASVLLLFSPPMLARLGGHSSLVGHFFILAALYLALRPNLDRRRLAWGVLLAAVTLVHAYFVAMIGLIWLADVAGRLGRRDMTWRTARLEVPGFLFLIVFTAWLAGYFSVGSGLVYGSYYGYYRANLLTFIDSGGWSYLLRDLPEGMGDYEGFNYLGLGVLLLALTALPQLATGDGAYRQSLARHRYVVIAVALLGAFAFSPNLGLGSFNFSLPVPELFTRAAEAFRSSGRMLWPAFYMLVLAILYVVLKGNRRSVARVLLVLAALVQVLDTRPSWAALRGGLMVERQDSLIAAPPDPFWEEAALRYDNIRVLPPANAPLYWLNIAAFAGTHGMATNAVYLARVDSGSYANAAAQSTTMLTTGNYDDNTLYILDASVVEQATANLPDAALLQQIDGVVVLAPGWLNR
jgi:hypothetical protein